MIDQHLTTIGGICAMQTTVSYDYDDYSEEVLGRWAAEARQHLDCQHVSGGSLGDAPAVLHQIAPQV